MGSYLFFENRTASHFRNGAQSPTSGLRAPAGLRAFPSPRTEQTHFRPPPTPPPLAIPETSIHSPRANKPIIGSSASAPAHEPTPADFGRTNPLHGSTPIHSHAANKPMAPRVTPTRPNRQSRKFEGTNPSGTQLSPQLSTRAPSDFWPNKPTSEAATRRLMAPRSPANPLARSEQTQLRLNHRAFQFEGTNPFLRPH